MRDEIAAHIFRYLLFSKEPIRKAIKRVEKLKRGNDSGRGCSEGTKG